jgi:ABC-2 type transport system ATP-binding protein
MPAGQATEALRVRQLRKAYADVVAVDGLDLEVARGECFGLLGPNGAGKTTTIEICEGLTQPDSGDVEVLGQRWGERGGDLRQRLGIQLQDTQLSEKLTVTETLRLFRSFYRQGTSVEHLIGLVQLGEKRNARVGALSGGQKQRLALACALVGDPELLFLDEPTTGFDPVARRAAWDTIRDLATLGKTIVLTTHYLDEVEALADRVVVIRDGQLVAEGAPGTLGAADARALVRFRLPPGVDPPELAELPLARAGDALEGLAADPTAALHALCSWALDAGVSLDGLEVRRPRLEDVYLELTAEEATA